MRKFARLKNRRLIITLLFLVAVGSTLALLNRQQIFKPKAVGESTDPETFRLQNPKSALENYLNPISESKIRIFQI
jgi:hypothetical protein